VTIISNIDVISLSKWSLSFIANVNKIWQLLAFFSFQMQVGATNTRFLSYFFNNINKGSVSIYCRTIMKQFPRGKWEFSKEWMFTKFIFYFIYRNKLGNAEIGKTTSEFIICRT